MERVEKFFVKDWTIYPGGRTKDVGPYSAEELGEVLAKVFEDTDAQFLYVYMDGVRGYALSFLDQLITELQDAGILHKVNFLSENQSYLDDLQFILDCHMRGRTIE